MTRDEYNELVKDKKPMSDETIKIVISNFTDKLNNETDERIINKYTLIIDALKAKLGE